MKRGLSTIRRKSESIMGNDDRNHSTIPAESKLERGGGVFRIGGDVGLLFLRE